MCIPAIDIEAENRPSSIGNLGAKEHEPPNISDAGSEEVTPVQQCSMDYVQQRIGKMTATNHTGCLHGWRAKKQKHCARIEPE